MAKLSSSTIFGDLDVTGNLKAGGLGGVASFTSTDTSVNINSGSWTPVQWDVQKLIDTTYEHDPSGSADQITFKEDGTYQVYASISYDSGEYRQNPGIVFSINGTVRDTVGLSGYSRNASGHNQASNSIMETISVSAGDTLRVECQGFGNTGTAAYLRPNESTLEITAKTVTSYKTENADTVDGYHASDFLKSGGDTITGNLNASDGITVSRYGSQLDASNSIESNGDWLGLDSNAGGNGVLIGYYNAPEVRIGNGNTQIELNASNEVDVGPSDGLILPVYSDTGSVPNLPEGTIVFVQGEGLMVEDGT